MITIRFFNTVIRFTSMDEEILHKHELAADIDWQNEVVEQMERFRSFIWKYRDDPLIKSKFSELLGIYTFEQSASAARLVLSGLKQQPWIDVKKMKHIDIRNSKH